MFFKNVYKSTLKQDKELYNILKKEKNRQKRSLELIASENFVSNSVLQANGSIFTNKYSEGYPKNRYYGGNEHIDELELLCQKRALKIFDLNPDKWGVNVQSYSGSTANFSVYTALLNPGDKLMGLDLPSGGHLTHGYKTDKKKISNSSIYFTSQSYKTDETGYIDMKNLEKSAQDFKPKLIIVGASSYTRDYNYSEFKRIADKNESYLMADIAHTSGLVASKLLKSPFKYADVVTTTTHKTLRGPRAALIFYKLNLKDKIDFSVFPSSQGGPHNNTICAIANALKQVDTQEFKKYSEQIIKNAKYLSRLMKNSDFNLITGGTDNHIILFNIKDAGITGSKFEKLAEMCDLSCNKNAIPGDKSPLNPSGVRIGLSAMTTRGFKEKDMEFILKRIQDIANLGLEIQNKIGSKRLIDFENNLSNYKHEINIIKKNINDYCNKFDYKF